MAHAAAAEPGVTDENCKLNGGPFSSNEDHVNPMNMAMWDDAFQSLFPLQCEGSSMNLESNTYS